MAGKIFINYRRDDDPGFTQALFGRLEQAFSQERLFMDVDSVPAGIDFVHFLYEQVAQCDVLLAIIGKNWINARDSSNVRRLDDPDDFVRVEIESALERGVRLVIFTRKDTSSFGIVRGETANRAKMLCGAL